MHIRINIVKNEVDSMYDSIYGIIFDQNMRNEDITF